VSLFGLGAWIAFNLPFRLANAHVSERCSGIHIVRPNQFCQNTSPPILEFLLFYLF